MRNATLTMALFAALQSACTFYTSCPPPAQNNPGGGSGNDGGGGSGGGNSEANLPEWVNVTSNLAGLDSACGNLAYLEAHGDRVYAGVNPGRLWATTDGGESWNELNQGKGTDPIDAGITSMTFDPDDDQRFWLSGIYGSHGVWRTDDQADTFTVLGNVSHTEVVSVDLTDPRRLVMVTGGHEQARTINRSRDGGLTWESIGANFPSGTPVSSYPHVIDSKVVLMGAAGYIPGKPGIFRSTNLGDSWTRVASSGGLGRPLVTSNGNFYWTSENGAVVKSDDQGKTWHEVAPAGTAVGPRSLAELPDHRLATLTQAGDYRIKITDDDFATLTQVVQHTPFTPSGFTYSASEKAFYIWHNDCGTVVLDDAIMRADFDYEAQ